MINLRHFISILDINSEDIKNLIDLSFYLKMKRRFGRNEKTLKDKNLVLIFEKPSTRTRLAFDFAAQELGMNTSVIDKTSSQLGRGEPLIDTFQVIERYADAVGIRTFKQKPLEEVSKLISIPIINALTDEEHPCQTIADLLTIKEKKGKKNIKVAYLGDGNNVCNSLLVGCASLGIDIFVATPEGYEPNKIYVDEAKRRAEKNNSKVVITNDPIEAVKDADVIYTDVWVSMGDKEKDINKFKPYQVNKNLVKHAKKDFIFMHCLPVHRGEEVTEDILESYHSVVFDQAENRLHTHKAILLYVFEL